METEKTLIRWLNDKGIPAYGTKPKDTKKDFVTVERTGGSVSDGIDSASFAIGCWSSTNSKASSLASQVGMLLPDFQDEEYATFCSVESVYRFPPGDGTGSRYQLTVSASIYI